MNRTKTKTSLPDNERLAFKVIENSDQRACLYDPIRQEIIKVLTQGFDDYTTDVKIEQRTLEDGTRITEEVKVEKPIRRFWMTVPEILDTLRTTNPSLSLATTKAYYHLGKLQELGFLEQFPESADGEKTRIRGRYFRTTAKFFVEVTVEASVGYSGLAVMPEEIGPRFVELGELVRRTGVAASMDYQVNLDGILLWVSMTMSRHSDGLNIIAVIRDITTHRTLEERLERSEVEFGRLVEESFQGYAIFQNGVPVFVNPAFAETVGRTQNELNLMTPDEALKLIHADDRHLIEERNRQLGVGAELLPRHRFRYIKPDGSIRWVESFGRKTEHLGKPALLVLEIDITEQIEAEHQLQKSEQRSRIIADTMSDLIVVFDSDNRYFEYFGDASLLTKPWKEMEGKKHIDLTPREITIFQENYSRQVRETGESITYEYQIELQGVVRWLQSTMMLHEDKESIVVAVKDISERKTAEESMKASERRFRELFDSSPVAIGRCNLEGAFTQINQAFLHLFGISGHDDAPGYRLRNDPHIPKWALDQVAEGKSVTFDIPYDFNRVKKLGLYRTIRTGIFNYVVTLSPLNLLPDTPESGFQVIIQDVTERLRAEEALRDSEEMYRTFFEQASTSIVVIDPLSKEMIDFNRHAYESLGYTKEEFKKLKLWDIDAGIEEKDIETKLMDIAENDSLVFETKHKTKRGVLKDVRVSTRRVSYRDRLVIQEIITDISDDKRVEEKLKRNEEQYRLLFESSSDAIILWRDIKVYDANSGALKLFGYELDELIGKTLWSLSPRKQPDGTSSKESAIRRIEETFEGNNQSFYWRNRTKDGTDFDTFISISAVDIKERVFQSVIRLEIPEHIQSSDII